jgi:inhibitor of KinA
MWQVGPAGDRALLITLGKTIEPALLAQVLALDRALGERRPGGLLGTVPSYASLLCYFDPSITSPERLTDEILAVEGDLPRYVSLGPLVDVPTTYDGPDLADVGAKAGLKPAEVIELHAGREYLAYCVGFAPGFTYCGELPDVLSMPRLASPRLRVPAGSVGIAGRQTGIYAVESPGGWNLIGRTAWRLFDPASDPPARFKAGDRLRFVPIHD